MNFYAVTGFVNFTAATLMSLFVGLRRRRDARHVTFVLYSMSVAIWSLFYGLWQAIATESSALMLCRALMMGAIFIPATFFHYVVTLVGLRSNGHRRLVIAGYWIACLFGLSNLTPLFIRGVGQQLEFPFWPLPGVLFGAYIIWFLTYVFYAIGLLYKGARRASGSTRKQLSYLAFGTLIAFGGGATNFFLWYGIPIPPVGNIGVPFYVLAAALAVVRFQFMDIKVAITRTGILVGVYFIVLGLPFAVGLYGQPWLRQCYGDRWWLAPLVLCTILAAAGPFAYAWLRRRAEERLLQHHLRYQRFLERAARGMTRVKELHRLERLIVWVVSRAVRVEHASLFLYDRSSQTFKLVASHGPKRLVVQSQFALSKNDRLIACLTQSRQVMDREDFHRSADELSAFEPAHLNAALIIPGFVERELIGFLVLGNKLSGDGYSLDDLHAFSVLAHEAAIAVENAKSYGEILKTNQQLQEAYEGLMRQQRLAQAGQFATGIAHEIKNPLAALKIFAQSLPEKYSDPIFRQKFFRIVQTEIDRIGSIVTELLDFAKPVARASEDIQVSNIIRETLALLSNQCLEQHVRVRIRASEQEGWIRGDAKQLRQVFLNLFLNSLDAMPSGGVLDVSVYCRENRVMIVASDTGCGILPEFLDRLFTPFQTTKEQGIGLGLVIVKGIVESHGGEITVRSQVGRGTIVTTQFPVITHEQLDTPRRPRRRAPAL